MSPAIGPTFETIVRNRLGTLLSDTGSQIVVDEVEPVEDAGVLLVSFHLEGAWASPAGFSFPFHESAPLDRSLAALRDLVSKNWDRAHVAPLVADRPARAAFGD